MDEATRAGLQIALKEAIRQREQAETTITFLSERLGGIPQLVGSEEGDANGQDARQVGPLDIREGQFFGQSSTKAVYAVLERAGQDRPLKTAELLDYIRRGGVKLGGRTPEQSLYRSLARDARFFNIGRGRWGLRAWYPDSVTRKGGKPATADEASSDGADDGDASSDAQGEQEAPSE